MKLKSLWTRPEARFLTLFLAILAISFTIVALEPVDDSVVMPYTAFVARMAAVILAGITLWILWAHRFAAPQRSAR